MWSYNYSTELYHHGIKGMKWGIRRYRNFNTGRKRQVKLDNKAEKKQFRKDVKQYRHDKRYIDFDISNHGNIRNVRNRGNETLNRLRVKKGNEYTNRILKADKRRNAASTIGILAGSAAAIAGYSYLATKYNF